MEVCNGVTQGAGSSLWTDSLLKEYLLIVPISILRLLTFPLLFTHPSLHLSFRLPPIHPPTLPLTYLTIVIDPCSLFALPTGKPPCPRAHMAGWHGHCRSFHNMVIIMGCSTGRDHGKYVNESNVESVTEQRGKEERATGCVLMSKHLMLVKVKNYKSLGYISESNWANSHGIMGKCRNEISFP